MKNFTQIFVLCFLAINGYGQENFNLELVAHVANGEPGNDIWGYVDADGTEYAIMGTETRTKIWSLEDPTAPIERASIEGPAGVWRDIKSFEDHLYVTSDQGNRGLLIIDMSGAPDTITSTYWNPPLEVGESNTTMDKCHNLYIDTEQGYCYLAGCDISEQGVLILDLNVDKEEPVLVGYMDNNYTHDVFVKNDKMYTSDVFLGTFNVYDVTDKTNPVYLSGAETSRRFTHNAWLSDDEKFLFTTDERSNAWVDAYDVSDLNDIQFLDRYQPIETQGTNVIPHNTHYMDGFLITSWYTDGVVILDANQPDNLVKVGSFDTETIFTQGFEGCWGAYPFLPSGLILASDINHGLFIFQPKRQDGEEGFQRAAYLEGTVTDALTGFAIPNATVEILSNNPNEAQTGLSGTYKTGQATTGMHTVEFSHPNYDTNTGTATLVSGEITTLDIALTNHELSGIVVDDEGNTIANASVFIENEEEGVEITTFTNEAGMWSTRVKQGIEYNIYGAKWGYKGDVGTILFDLTNTVSLVLPKGYEDDFFTDLGWSREGNATSGLWEIARPNFIFGSGQTTQTNADIQTDLGETYYVSGASGSGQGSNDIDNGSIVLTSQPMDFTGFDRIDLSYYIWFTNIQTSNNPNPANDYMTVSITNGTETVELTRIDQNGSTWSPIIEISVGKDQMAFNDQMQVIVFATDDDPGHIVEVGFDAFKADGFKTTGVEEQAHLGMSVYPNPSYNTITLKTLAAWEGDKNVTIFDISGKVVLQKQLTDPEMKIDVTQLSSGLYSVQIIGDNKISETIKFSKI